nr:RNA-directed DNA polymerase, eukaryota [Tanacetum cinerariifolium]
RSQFCEEGPNDDRVSDVEEVSKTINHIDESKKQQSEDPFNIYRLLRKQPGDDSHEVSSSLSHPPGFTPDVSVIRNENGQSAKEIPVVINAKVMNNSQDVYKEASCDNMDPNVVKRGGSVLGVMEDMIRVGKAMGYSMDGCVKDLEQIIGTQGVGDEETVFKKDYATIFDNFVAIYGTWLPSNSKVLFVAIYAPQQADFGPIPFRFYHSWISLEGFDAMVEQTLRSFSHNDANRMIRFKKKIHDLKFIIRAWINDKRSSVSGEKDSIKKELSDIDRLLDGGDVFDSNLLRRSELHRNLYNINQMESKEYLHKFKIKWAIEGDENLKVFHGLINKKRAQLAIREVFVDDIWCTNPNKITDAKFVNDFQPISLIGSAYKVVTKVLANRLALVILGLISDQSAFIANRQILNGPFILNELLHWCKRKKKQVMFFKVDFSKAYDSVRWDYLLDVLEDFGLGNIWCKWIRGTFSSAKASVLTVIRSNFSGNIGILLALIYVTLLSIFLRPGVFKGVHLHGSTSISHLFYVDDVMFIGEWSDDNLKGINILQCFFLASGLKINIQKSKVLGEGVPSSIVMHAASSIDCGVLHKQFRYLGVMVGECMSRHNAWASTVDKLRSRLSKWKVKTLCIGGRLTLLKAILGASPLYNMSIFK